MTIFALCGFSAGQNPNPDAGTEALRQAGYTVFRLPPALKADLEFEGDDYIEVRGAGEEDARDAMKADVNRILEPFGGWIDDYSGFLTIAEMWAPQPPPLPRCDHCMDLETSDRTLLSVDVGGGERDVLLHSECRKPWIDALVEAGGPIPF